MRHIGGESARRPGEVARLRPRTLALGYSLGSVTPRWAWYFPFLSA